MLYTKTIPDLPSFHLGKYHINKNQQLPVAGFKFVQVVFGREEDKTQEKENPGTS